MIGIMCEACTIAVHNTSVDVREGALSHLH